MFFKNSSALNTPTSVMFSADAKDNPLFVKCFITFFFKVPAKIIFEAQSVNGAKNAPNSSFDNSFKFSIFVVCLFVNYSCSDIPYLFLNSVNVFLISFFGA